MATLLRVPEVAAGATEAVLSEWLVNENTPFGTGDPIVTLETDKASVEMTAESDGVILRALVSGGTTVEVGSPMALIGTESERGADVAALLVELGITSGTAVGPQAPEVPQGPEVSQTAASVPAPAPVSAAVNTRVFISPLARRMLKEAGLTTDQARGTGPHGRIVRRDVERAVETARAVAAAVTPLPEPAVSTPPARTAEPQLQTAGFRDVPHSRSRRAVANRVTTSKQTIPHFYVKRTATIDALLDLRKQLNDVAPQKISINDLVIKAVAVAHRAVPDANVIWTDKGMRQFESVDVAVAIAAERGLVMPVLRGIERMSPSAIARQVRTYVRQAGEGTLQQGDLEGGSLSVSNLGMHGVDEFSAIINPPHSAILAVGAGRPAAVVVEGTLEIATQMTLVLSVDHRAIDGALAAQWMEALVGALEQPLRLVA